ncbi:MAG: aminotransferase class I/II-fold pyridoxal phosphate-dependent enzyme, partial [Propionibacteriaceae bacterium]|nr:aminotransferase class I/II-fold pyridoxal phosphate-dependent enzyme [Propionibacteriaceae bacterium]
MAYDFDTIINRFGTNSVKWNIDESELPMWVADMDFATAPAITQAVINKAVAGVFGYGCVPQTFNDAIISWWSSRYGWKIESEWIYFCDGVVPSISSIMRTLTDPGDSILVQSPVYDCFYSSIRNCDRTAMVNNLVYDQGGFHIDWADLEAKLSDPTLRLFLLCNPQNPTGQIWSSQDLARIGDLAHEHQVTVISDEIHGDITAPGISYIPFAKVSPV